MVFRGLPPEIQFRILELCSPSDLAALSRVHTSGRDMAEYALYSRIQCCLRASDLIIGLQELKQSRSLLHTLANNSRKALIVKMFYVEYDDDDFYQTALTCEMRAHFITAKLAEALVKTSNLVDLCILNGWMDDTDTQKISEVIRFVFISCGMDGD